MFLLNRAYYLLRALRPQQWLKNAAVLAGLVFNQELHEADARAAAGIAFVAFCLASSSGYLLNDLLDQQRDRESVRNRHRPIAAGLISNRVAVVAMFVCLAAALLLSQTLPLAFTFVLVAYVTLSCVYTLKLKHWPYVDVITLAVLFLLRIQGGIEALYAPNSAWILVTSGGLALFLGFAKRRSELRMEKTPALQRPVLAFYTAAALDRAILFGAGVAFASYSLYTTFVRREVGFALTVLPVLAGLLRYIERLKSGARTDSPERMLIEDRVLTVIVAVWAVLVLAAIYT